MVSKGSIQFDSQPDLTGDRVEILIVVTAKSQVGLNEILIIEVQPEPSEQCGAALVQ
jgi:hypothetical protein